MIVYFLVRSLQFLFSFIFFFPASMAIYLMRLAGNLTYQIARVSPIKSMAGRNIRAFFPQADAAVLADKLLRNVGLSIFEVLCTPFFQPTHLNRICDVKGLENVDLALAKRKGALVLAMHVGNYELTPTLLCSRGYRVSSILKAGRDPLLRLVNRSRAYKGIQLINVEETDMYREALRALGADRCVYLLIDTGALESRHESISFLGKQLPAATGWLTLAQRSGASVIPSLSKREGDKVVITFGEPLQVYPDNREEVMEKVRLYYESFIQNHPEQWAVFLNEYEIRRMIENASE